MIYKKKNSGPPSDFYFLLYIHAIFRKQECLKYSRSFNTKPIYQKLDPPALQGSLPKSKNLLGKKKGKFFEYITRKLPKIKKSRNS